MPQPAGATTAAATFITGLYLHLTRLFFGLDAVTDRILTPTVDGIFGLVMAYAAVAGWLSWRGVEHPNRAHKIIFGVILGYMTVSAVSRRPGSRSSV